jgi:hypothetical protein
MVYSAIIQLPLQMNIIGIAQSMYFKDKRPLSRRSQFVIIITTVKLFLQIFRLRSIR